MFRALAFGALLALAGCPRASAPSSPSSSADHVALRFGPGTDLRVALTEAATSRGLEAAAVVSCVGSLRVAALRFADQPDVTTLEGPFEITSLVGTLGPDGPHLHVTVADREGRAFGGHLAPGSLVYTTAEVVLVELRDVRFRRLPDPATGYDELAIEPR